MSNIYTWDIETRWGSGEIIKIGVFNGLTTEYFNTVEEFWQYLVNENNKNEKIYMYAHHHEFDIIGIIMDEFAIKNIEVDLMRTMFTKNKKVLKLYFKELKNIEFRDSFRLFPMSLKKVTIGFECKHKKLNVVEEAKKAGYKYKTEKDFFNNIDRNDPLLLRYLEYDIRGLHEAIMKFTDITSVSVKKMITIAATAMAVFKEQFPKSFKRMITNRFEKEKRYGRKIKEFSRKAFKGGRVEIIRRKGEKVYKYDVNSLYPYVMASFNYPTGNYKPYYKSAAKAKLNSLKWSKNPPLGLVEATVFIPYTKVPPLPVRVKGKLYFPYDEMRCTWTTVELLHAIKKYNVIVKEVHEMWLWDEKCNPFSEYVTKFFKLKSDGTGAVKLVAKLLMNSLYGKFGLREEGIRIVYVEDYEKNENLQKKEILYEREIGGKRAYVLEDRIYANYILPHISAFITSYARLVLLKKIEELLERGYEVFYYDTDSVHTNCPEEEFFGVDKKKLGYWKFEGYDEVMYYASPKLYASEDRIKAKGIPKDYHPRFEMFKEMIEGDLIFKHIFTGTRLRTLWEVLTNSNLKEREVVVSKVVSLLNDKRKPINNLETEPWKFKEILQLTLRKKVKRGKDGKVRELLMSVNGEEVRLYSEFVRLIETLFNKEGENIETKDNRHTA